MRHSDRQSLEALNRLYGRLDGDAYEVFWAALSKLCRPDFVGWGGATWTVHVGGRPFVLPLDRDDLWLHWDLALSLLGHDRDVKREFDVWWQSTSGDRTVFDVGASYGLTSLYMTRPGTRVVSFEPNAECHAYHERVAVLNGFACEICAVALGRAPGETTLLVPDTETWLGTVRPELAARVVSAKGAAKMRAKRVRVSTLDNEALTRGVFPDFIKLDAEGAELSILQGAKNILEESAPTIIFESHLKGDRKGLYQLFAGWRYRVRPLGTAHRCEVLAQEEFCAFQADNFLASRR